MAVLFRDALEGGGLEIAGQPISVRLRRADRLPASMHRPRSPISDGPVEAAALSAYWVGALERCCPIPLLLCAGRIRYPMNSMPSRRAWAQYGHRAASANHWKAPPSYSMQARYRTEQTITRTPATSRTAPQSAIRARQTGSADGHSG